MTFDTSKLGYTEFGRFPGAWWALDVPGVYTSRLVPETLVGSWDARGIGRFMGF